ncbi:hypothetical protein BaRGS_00015050, partial [Batillaria attramentaria]
NYFDAYKTRMMSLKGHNSACDTGDSFSWLLTSGCHDITQETVCSSIGLAAGPLWVIGHFLILTASGKKRTRNKTPPWITWSLLPHCLADVISCVGAILAMQYFPQIVFAFTVMFVHCTVAVVLLAYHLWCSTTKYDLHGEKLVRGGCSVSFCCFSPLKSCPLVVLAVVSFVTCDAQTTGEAVTMETVHLNDGELPLTWWEITGEIMGTIACVGHWLATGYDIIGIYRPSRHHRRQASGVFLMAVANMGYLVSVYGRSAGLTLHTLPWTLASSSSGSDVSGSNVLWESTWKERLRSTMFQPEYPKLQAVTPVYPISANVSNGRQAQPANRTVAYDLLQSTDTSCSRTAEQDTEAS